MRVVIMYFNFIFKERMNKKYFFFLKLKINRKKSKKNAPILFLLVCE